MHRQKSHTHGETIIKPTAIAISRAMHGDKLAHELESVPLSNGTIAQRITDLTEDMKQKHKVDGVKKGKYGLQLDKSTDISIYVVFACIRQTQF